MNRAKIVAAGLILATVALAALLLFDEKPKSAGKKPLVMFCAAGMKAPVTRIAAMYEAEHDIPVQLQFGGSGSLLTSLQVTAGDIYLAADESYLNIAREKGMVDEIIPAAYLTAGIGVARGNPHGIRSLKDLKRGDLRIGFAVPDAASVGKFSREVLTEHGLWEPLRARAHLMAGTVTELANGIKLGALDAAVLWDAVAAQYEELDFVHTPEFDKRKKQVTIGILSDSRQPTAALRFARFLTARDRGLPVFTEDGYETIRGDAWAERPEVLLYSGAMLRPALAAAVTAFEAREGVAIRPVYNGCGILVSQMKAGEQPDAYFSCDIQFMDVVEDRFENVVTVTANDMVILVAKGNPKTIRTVADLANPGVRLGLAHPDKSALGALAKGMLENEGVYAAIIESGNLKVDSATGDFLVNQIRAASLDAVIVYASNARATPATMEDCDIVAIDAPDSRAYQPFAIGRDSDHRQLMRRFLARITDPASQEEFQSYGFHWELAPEGED